MSMSSLSKVCLHKLYYLYYLQIVRFPLMLLLMYLQTALLPFFFTCKLIIHSYNLVLAYLAPLSFKFYSDIKNWAYWCSSNTPNPIHISVGLLAILTMVLYGTVSSNRLSPPLPNPCLVNFHDHILPSHSMINDICSLKL